MRTFEVDEVVAVETRLPRVPIAMESLVEGRVSARSESIARCVHSAGPRMNGLLLTVHRAFSEHRPLTLSPDDLWMAILQGFAIHVRENADVLRERFIEFHGRKTLEVEVETSTVEAILDCFEVKLGEELSPGLMRSLTDRFSTSTEDTHVAFCIAAMDAFSSYFDYSLVGVCGIPRITLTGTLDDWLAVRDRFRVLAEFDLQWWAKRLEPVLEQFIYAASGHVDVEFWRSIYKPQDAYGGEVITGWVLRLFPYCEEAGRFTRNLGAFKGWVHEPCHPADLPHGLSCARIRVNESKVWSLHSGFFGVEQLTDGSLAPLIGWSVSESPLDQLFDALAHRHRFEPTEPGCSWSHGPADVPAVLQAFAARFGSGTLYDGEVIWLQSPTWSPSETGPSWRSCPQFVGFSESTAGPETRAAANDLEGKRYDASDIKVVHWGLHFATLRDGRRLIWLRHQRREMVLLMNENAGEHVVIADSMLELLQRLANNAAFPPWEIKGTWSLG